MPTCFRSSSMSSSSWPILSVSCCNCKFQAAKIFEVVESCLPLPAGEISASFGKSSLKHSKNFRIILSNQKLARALTSTPKAVTRINTLCCLATSGTKTAGSVTSRIGYVAINWHLFPRLLPALPRPVRLIDCIGLGTNMHFT